MLQSIKVTILFSFLITEDLECEFYEYLIVQSCSDISRERLREPNLVGISSTLLSNGLFQMEIDYFLKKGAQAWPEMCVF